MVKFRIIKKISNFLVEGCKKKKRKENELFGIRYSLVKMEFKNKEYLLFFILEKCFWICKTDIMFMKFNL